MQHDDTSAQPLLEVDYNRPQDVVSEYFTNTHLPQKPSDLEPKLEVRPLSGSSISPQHPTQVPVCACLIQMHVLELDGF